MTKQEVIEYCKENKKKIIFFGAGGALLLISGIAIGKRIGIKYDSIAFSHQMGNVARDIIVSNPILPEKISPIAKVIDEDIFVDIASEIENSLVDLEVNDLHLERSWNVAEGIVKTLSVTMETIKK